IFMNNPLRYAGLTFYQAGFENNDTTSILQIIRNPSWLLPYIACVVMTLGLLIQFGLHLFAFISKRRASSDRSVPAPKPIPTTADPAASRASPVAIPPPPPAGRAKRFLPLAVVVLAALAVLVTLRPSN